VIAQFHRVVALGAEVLILRDDGAHKGGPMISPAMWRRFVLPYDRQIVDQVPVPMINSHSCVPTGLARHKLFFHDRDTLRRRYRLPVTWLVYVSGDRVGPGAEYKVSLH
jgi:hypothetical protein